MKRIKQVRRACKLTQREFAEHLGVPATTYCSWENEKRDPPVSMILKMSYLFGCSTDYLLGRGADDSQLIRPLKIVSPKTDFFNP